jgi:hypothetical protein
MALQYRWLAALIVVAAVALPAPARAQGGAETVIEWNRILLATVATPGAQPPTIFFPRSLAIVHVAIFDALNSIDFRYTPYATRADVPAGASPDAAVAQAAHDTLVALFPNHRADADAALAATLSRLPAEAAQSGAHVGAAAARAVLELRAQDGWQRLPQPYLLTSLPGYWQPAPPQNAAATLTHFPDVTGFISETVHPFMMEPPPALTSAAYAAAFNEVKALGGTTSTIRTEEQTFIARRWAGIGTTTPFQSVWNNLVRDLARRHGLDALDTARIYALLNMTFHDALRVSFSGKFIYGLWRPVTAIRAADRDGNPATETDPAWVALIPNPPYPSYPGNMACVGSSLARVLARVFGRDDVSFTVTWGEANGPGQTRSYNGFWQLGEEQARSRVYGGIHYQFDTTASFGVCPGVADYAFENHLRRRFP